MFIIDNILLSPARGLLAIFREIHKAALQEAANEAETVRTELSQLYMMLETGQITDAEFDRREKELLDRLDAIETPDPEAEDDNRPDQAAVTVAAEEER